MKHMCGKVRSLNVQSVYTIGLQLSEHVGSWRCLDG